MDIFFVIEDLISTVYFVVLFQLNFQIVNCYICWINVLLVEINSLKADFQGELFFKFFWNVIKKNLSSLNCADGIQCLYRTNDCKSLLVGLYWCVYVLESTGEHCLWVHLCFSRRNWYNKIIQFNAKFTWYKTVWNFVLYTKTRFYHLVKMYLSPCVYMV